MVGVYDPPRVPKLLTLEDESGKKETFFRGLVYHDYEKLETLRGQTIEVCYVELWQALPIPMTYYKPVRILHPDGEVSQLVPPARMIEDIKEYIRKIFIITLSLLVGLAVLCRIISK